jgi:GT2 family glycosyltransferase
VESVIGNTGAFMMIRKDLFDSIGGFNENYSSCFEDMELNLESIVKGKYNLNVGDSVLYHYESLTRNDDVDKIKKMGEDGKNILFPFIDKNFKYFKSYLNRI